MLDALTITEAEAAGLSRLAALDLAMAEDFAARARAAEDPDIANDLARSYQRMARSYRQSLALKLRLAREIAAVERLAAATPPPPLPPIPRDDDRIDVRVEELRPAIQRVIWAEHEPADWNEPDENNLCGYFLDLLEDRLRERAKNNRFGLEPLDDHVIALCADMTLSTRLARRWRDLPDPPPEGLRALEADEEEDDEPAGPERRGSG